MSYKVYSDIGREDGQVLEISTHYNEGGMSMFDYKQQRRGLYVSFSLVKKTEYGTKRLLFNDASFKILALEMTRRNKKKDEALGVALAHRKAELTELYKANDRQKLLEIVTSLIR